MSQTESVPEVLGTWNRYVDAYEHIASHGPVNLPPPTEDLMRAFAGALVASLTGGVADPFSGGAGVILPDGRRAHVEVSIDGPDDAALAFASAPAVPPVETFVAARPSPRAEVTAVVRFAGYRPRVVHLIGPPQRESD